MSFIEANLETYLQLLNKLEETQLPLWGNMSAQRMVEHLTDSINMARGLGEYNLNLPEEKAAHLKAFIYTDKPMAKNISVSFALPETALRNDSLFDAIDEFTLAWVDFEEEMENQPDRKTMHPYYGLLSNEEWLLLHAKHFTHHIEQFGLR